MDIYLAPFKKYFEFKGRAGRREYWTFTLVNWAISLVLSFIDKQVGLAGSDGAGVLGGLFSLAILIPGLAVSVRRLHDIGKSGWNLLWLLLPIIGWILLLVYLLKPSAEGKNKYDGVSATTESPAAPVAVASPEATPQVNQ